MLTRFEMAKIVGVRAMQLSEGHFSRVEVEDESLRHDYTYVASLELYRGLLDVCFKRGDEVLHVWDVVLPPDLEAYLNTRDGGTRVRRPHVSRT